MKKNEKYDAVNKISISVNQVKGKLDATSSLLERSTLSDKLRSLRNELKKIIKGA